MNPLSIVSNVLSLITYIYNTSEAVKENREECKRFCDHANLVMHALRGRCNGTLNARFVHRLLSLQQVVNEIKATVQALACRSLLKRVFLHDDLSARIKRAYNEMHNAVNVFNLDNIVDMASLRHASEAAKQMDRRNFERKWEHVLRYSREDGELLEQLQIRQGEMQEALISIRKRVTKAQNQVERKILERGMQALERCSKETTRNIPDEWTITSLDVIIHRDKKLGQGGFAKVYQADWRGTRVAIKELERGTSIIDFEKEINVWKRLHHPNIVQFYGACSISDPLFMVCALKANGNAINYLFRYPNADRCKLLHESSLGLVYLHQQGVVHGDLKGNNILVDEHGTACLSDFGLSKTKASSSIISNVSPARHGTLNWMAPEQLTGSITKETDVYNFGMTMYEIFSGAPPFTGCPEIVVVENIRRGVRPPTLLEQPSTIRRGLNSQLWSIIVDCWQYQPGRRPHASKVSERLLLYTSRSYTYASRRARSTSDLRKQKQQQPLTRTISNVDFHSHECTGNRDPPTKSVSPGPPAHSLCVVLDDPWELPYSTSTTAVDSTSLSQRASEDSSYLIAEPRRYGHGHKNYAMKPSPSPSSPSPLVHNRCIIM